MFIPETEREGSGQTESQGKYWIGYMITWLGNIRATRYMALGWISTSAACTTQWPPLCFLYYMALTLCVH